MWPPKGIHVIDAFSLPLLNTMILLCSGTTITWAHHSLIHGDRDGLKKGLWATIILGAVFSMIQAYEYAEARSEEHTSELQSLMRISYAVFCLKKKKTQQTTMYLIQQHR